GSERSIRHLAPCSLSRGSVADEPVDPVESAESIRPGTSSPSAEKFPCLSRPTDLPSPAGACRRQERVLLPTPVFLCRNTLPGILATLRGKLSHLLARSAGREMRMVCFPRGSGRRHPGMATWMRPPTTDPCHTGQTKG